MVNNGSYDYYHRYADSVGGLLYLTIDDAVYVPFYDNNGNITHYIDSNGNTVANYTYDAFGGILSATGPMVDVFRFRFSTKYLDAETGLYYYGYRFYHPALMRWLNRDPIGEDGGANLYQCLSNNSLSHYDYLGENDVSAPLDYASFITWSAEVQYMTYVGTTALPFTIIPKKAPIFAATPQKIPGVAPAYRRRSSNKDCPYFLARKLTVMLFRAMDLCQKVQMLFMTTAVN